MIDLMPGLRVKISVDGKEYIGTIMHDVGNSTIIPSIKDGEYLLNAGPMKYVSFKKENVVDVIKTETPDDLFFSLVEMGGGFRF